MLRWPLPALLAWGGAWALFTMLLQLGLPGIAALLLATAAGAACSLLGAT